MALVLNAPLGDVLADDGRVDVTILAGKIGVSVPEIAKVVGKSRSLFRTSPTAKSAQRRALTLVDRINDLAGELGGLKFAIAWIKTPMRQLGNRSTFEVLSGDDRSFALGIGFIDDYINGVPD